MEALEFLKEYKRMCTEYEDCNGCPLADTGCAGCIDSSEKQLINIVDKTEQWSKEHPIITNAQKFEEVFGFHPADFKTLFNFNKSYDGKELIWWDDPYKEEKHE